MAPHRALSASLIAVLLSSCAAVTPKLDLPAPIVVNDVRVEVTDTLSYLGRGGIGGFRGAATNQSAEPLSYCVINLELLDTTGAKIGDAMATTTHLGAGQTWRFDAHNANVISSPVGQVRVVNVQTNRSLIAGFVKLSPPGSASTSRGGKAIAAPHSNAAANATPSADEQADRVEQAILRIGETRPVAGAATEPFTFMIQLSRAKGDGTFEANFQEVAVVHTVVGNMTDGVALYRVGLVGGEPRIVLSGRLNSHTYSVLWESWPDNWRRAGSPASATIEFDH